MSKKLAIFIIISCVAGLALLVFFTTFGFYKAYEYPSGPKKFLVRKIKNENMFMNFLKPYPESIIKQGDLIIYKSPVLHDPPFEKRENICSRVIAGPGDIVTIKDTKVFVNDVAVDETYDRYFLFRVSMAKHTNFDKLLKNFRVQIIDSLNDNKACNFVATQYIADQIADIDSVLNVRKIYEPAGRGDVNSFVGQSVIWNMDNFGPVAVPQKGVTVLLNNRNIAIYKKIIGDYENHNLYFSGENISIDDKPADKYVIGRNYYFVLNDNRYNQPDSRIWGFIPESLIVGKVMN